MLIKKALLQQGLKKTMTIQIIAHEDSDVQIAAALLEAWDNADFAKLSPEEKANALIKSLEDFKTNYVVAF